MQKLYKNKTWLYHQYWKNKLTTIKVANICNVDKSTILDWMNCFNIKRRTNSEAQLLRKKENNKYRNEKWLKSQYWKHKLSIPKIAKICKINDWTVLFWMRKFNIQRRTKSEALRGNKCAWFGKNGELHPMYGVTGKNHPQWKGGISLEPYGLKFNRKLRENIRIRDDYMCQFCGTKKNGREFPIHHANYDKKDNNGLNLLTLCDSHNSKANFDRDKWQFLFETIQELRFYK